MKELQPSSVAELLPLAPAALDCLSRCDVECQYLTLAASSKDGGFQWIARGNALEVVQSSSGQRLAAWCFGVSAGEHATYITAVCELSYERSSKLVVSTTTPSTTTALLCLFDINTSMVTKVIEIPYKVCVLECVCNVGAEYSINEVLSRHLQCFCGAVAIGTEQGHIYVIDLCLDEETDNSNELEANRIQFVDLHMTNIASRRYQALCKQKHLCIELGEESHRLGQYKYHKTDGSVIQSFDSDEVAVCSLHFCPSIGTLCVGYNFGCFQLWHLKIPVLVYSSSLEDNLLAVTHFAYQEPENDPRNFCYLWVVKGPLPEHDHDATSNMMLFQLNFNKKTWHANLGYVYEDLCSVWPRFHHDLTCTPSNTDNTNAPTGSRVIRCTTLNTDDESLTNRSMDESSSSKDLSLCMIVWEAYGVDLQSTYFLALYDLNRWYHAQMPSSIRTHNIHEMNQFFSFYTLERISAMASERLLTAHIPYQSVSRFHSALLPMPEQHFLPASLAFNLCCGSIHGIIHSKFLGIQRQILSDLQKTGPSALVQPTELYHLCLYAGLLPRHMDANNVPSLLQIRELLLSVAVDNMLVGYVVCCINAWADGELSNAGCTLRLILDWAWANVIQIKESMDKLCVTLYDWSGIHLDDHSTRLLHHQHVTLGHLVTILEALSSVQSPVTSQGQLDLEAKLQVVKLVEQYLGIVLCFYSQGLLPEHAEDESELGNNQYSYPIKILRESYGNRRSQLQALNGEVGAYDVLLIDGLMEDLRDPLAKIWTTSETASAVYPPPSLHALINMYLVEGVSLTRKHTIVLYLLCDLMSYLPREDDDSFQQKLIHFAQSFGITPSLSKLIQGMWHLDHKEFDEAMLFLLDPSVSIHLSTWHRRITKSFLYHSRPQLALRYMRIKKPPLETPQDVKLRLTVLIANGLISEAFFYQRKTRDSFSSEDLLAHLFLGCQQTKTIDRLLQLPLSDIEEQHLINYLKTSHENGCNELLVMHFLQRGRYIEAVSLNNRIKHTAISELDNTTRERALARNAIVDCYQQVLPQVQRKLAFSANGENTRRKVLSRREVLRPVPLSAVVNHACQKSTMSRSSLIAALMDRVEETRPLLDHNEPIVTASQESGYVFPGRLACNPTTPVVTKTNSAIPDAVFPVMYEASIAESSLSTSLMSPKMRKNRSDHILSADCLSVLQTPPVLRKARVRSLVSISTPASILKSKRPKHAEQSNKKTEPRKATPPRYFQIDSTNAVRTPVTQFEVKTPSTVSKLRFADEPDGVDDEVESPTETITPTQETPTDSNEKILQPKVENTPKQLRFSVAELDESDDDDSMMVTDTPDADSIVKDSPVVPSVAVPPLVGFTVTTPPSVSFTVPTTQTCISSEVAMASDNDVGADEAVLTPKTNGNSRRASNDSDSSPFKPSPLARRSLKDRSPTPERQSPKQAYVKHSPLRHAVLEAPTIAQEDQAMDSDSSYESFAHEESVGQICEDVSTTDDVHSSTLPDTACNTTTAHAIEKETRVTFLTKTQENDQTPVVVASSGLDTTNNEHTKVVVEEDQMVATPEDLQDHNDDQQDFPTRDQHDADVQDIYRDRTEDHTEDDIHLSLDHSDDDDDDDEMEARISDKDESHSTEQQTQQESCVVASLPKLDSEREETNMDKEKDEFDNVNTDRTIENTFDVAAVNDDDSEVILNFHCQDTTKVDSNEADVTTEIDNNSNVEEVPTPPAQAIAPNTDKICENDDVTEHPADADKCKEMQIDIREHPQSEETSTDNLAEEMSETDPSKLSTVGKTRETRRSTRHQTPPKELEPLEEKDPKIPTRQSPTRETQQTPTRETQQTPTRETRQTPTRETRQNPTRETRQTPTRETRQTPTRETRQTPTRETRQTPTRETRQTPTRESRQTPTRETRQTPTRETRQTPTRETRQTPTRETRQTTTKDTKTPPRETRHTSIRVPTSTQKKGRGRPRKDSVDSLADDVVIQNHRALSTRTTRSCSRRSMSQASDVSTTHSVTHRKDGPLSSGSFMMSLRNRKSISRETTPESISLRSRRSTSRETTPEPRNMSDLSSVATEDDIGDMNAFVFSVPAQFNADTAFEPAPEALNSFVFSPPLTRAKRRQSIDRAGTPVKLFGNEGTPQKSTLIETPTSVTKTITRMSTRNTPSKLPPDNSRLLPPECEVSLLEVPSAENTPTAVKRAQSKVAPPQKMSLRAKRPTKRLIKLS